MQVGSDDGCALRGRNLESDEELHMDMFWTVCHCDGCTASFRTISPSLGHFKVRHCCVAGRGRGACIAAGNVVDVGEHPHPRWTIIIIP